MGEKYYLMFMSKLNFTRHRTLFLSEQMFAFALNFTNLRKDRETFRIDSRLTDPKFITYNVFLSF